MLAPLLEQDVLDKEAAKKLIEHVIEGGVSGIFLLGSTGEGPSLSYKARREVVSYCCEVVAKRLPVLVGVSDTAFGETIALAKFAHEAGASAIVLTQPYYFTMGQSEMAAYVERVLKEIPEGLAVMLYGIPFLTKACWDVETVLTLAKRHKQIIGVKDSSGDLPYFEKLCTLKKELPDFTIMIGPEHLLPQALAAGGDGGVFGGSNILPKMFVGQYEALANGEDEKKKEIFAAGINLFQDIYTLGAPSDHQFSRIIAGTKCAAAAKGLCGLHVSQPFTGYDESQLEKAKAILSKVEEKLKEAE